MNVLLRRLWHVLTEPSGTLATSHHHQQARTLSALLILLIFSTLLVLLTSSAYKTLFVETVIGLCVAYALSRTRHINLAILLSISILALPAFITLRAETDFQTRTVTHHLAWLVFPVMLANLVLPLRGALAVTAAAHIAILLTPVSIPGLSFYAVLEGLELVWATSGLILISSVMRQHYVRQLRSANRQLADQSVTLAREVAEHKRTAQRLIASEARHRLLYEQTPAMLHSIDPQGRLVNVSTHWLDVMGYTRDEVIGHRSVEFLTEVSRKTAEEIALPHLFQHGCVNDFPHQFVKKNGEIIDILMSAIALHDDPHSLAVLVDITQQKRAEEAYRKLVDHSLQGLTISQNGRVVFANQAYVKMSGYTLDELLTLESADFVEMVHPDDRDRVVNHYWKHETEFPQADHYMMRLRRKEGDYVWLEVFPSVIEYQGKPAVQSALINITEHKRAEQREKDLIVEREKVRALEEFINDLSHDFRTSLTVINTHIYLLHKRITDDAHQKQLALMQKHSTRLMHMIDDMFEMFELDMQMDLPMAPVNLTSLLHTVAADYRVIAAEKKQILALELSDTPTLVWGHANGLERIITSLLVNALQFTDAGGTIMLRNWGDNQQVFIEVTDTGIGIREMDKPHIFKRFFRADKARPTDGGGTGLGLAIAQNIVERHQGWIEVKSVEHEGSTFRVVLPRYNQSLVIL